MTNGVDYDKLLFRERYFVFAHCQLKLCSYVKFKDSGLKRDIYSHLAGLCIGKVRPRRSHESPEASRDIALRLL